MSTGGSHDSGSGAQCQILLVGLGEVAGTHLKVLERHDSTVVVAGVDPSLPPAVTFRGRSVPVYATLREAADHHDPAIVVVATPTPTHAAVCVEVAERLPAAEILLEKPAADNIEDARRVLGPDGAGQRLVVAYHMAFSPEVRWGQQVVQDRASDLGPPVAAQSLFADPYAGDLRAATARLSTSWVDSGINALSVLQRFVEPAARRSLRSLGPESWSAFEARIACRTDDDTLDALILTNWQVTDAARTTRIRYASGAELVMDHVAVAGCLLKDGAVVAMRGTDGSVPRRESHYRELYRWWLGNGRPPFPVEVSRRLHELLLAPEA